MAKVILSEIEKQRILSENLDKNYYLDSMLKRLRKLVEQEGKLEVVKRKEFFLSKSERRREKSKRAKIRLIKQNKNRKRFQKITER